MSIIDREVLFSNERLLIGMLQAVSGASVVAAISQWEALTQHAGILGVLIFLTVMALALVLAVLAAYWKHEYKKWDVKAQVSRAQSMEAAHHDRHLSANLLQEAYGKSQLADRRLALMRGAMLGSTAAIVSAVVALVAALWLSYLRG